MSLLASTAAARMRQTKSGIYVPPTVSELASHTLTVRPEDQHYPYAEFLQPNAPYNDIFIWTHGTGETYTGEDTSGYDAGDYLSTAYDFSDCPSRQINQQDAKFPFHVLVPQLSGEDSMQLWSYNFTGAGPWVPLIANHVSLHGAVRYVYWGGISLGGLLCYALMITGNPANIQCDYVHILAGKAGNPTGFSEPGLYATFGGRHYHGTNDTGPVTYATGEDSCDRYNTFADAASPAEANIEFNPTDTGVDVVGYAHNIWQPGQADVYDKFEDDLIADGIITE